MKLTPYWLLFGIQLHRSSPRSLFKCTALRWRVYRGGKFLFIIVIPVTTISKLTPALHRTSHKLRYNISALYITRPSAPSLRLRRLQHSNYTFQKLSDIRSHRTPEQNHYWFVNQHLLQKDRLLPSIIHLPKPVFAAAISRCANVPNRTTARAIRRLERSSRACAEERLAPNSAEGCFWAAEAWDKL